MFLKALTGFMVYTLAVTQVIAQTAALVPNAKQTFLGTTGAPLAAGTVTMYVPGSTTKKTTWVDPNQASTNTNPVVLDAAGRSVIFGQGNYRQVVKDKNGVTIWDGFTSAYGSSAPSGATGTDTAPVGSVMAYGGFTVPTNWQLAYGQTLNRTTFAALKTAITITDSSVNCTSGSAILTNFASTAQFRIGAPIEGTCFATGITIASILSSTSITISSNATATSTFATTVFPWGNGDGVATFNVPDLRGKTFAGANAMGGTPSSTFQASSTISTTSGTPTVTVTSATGISAGMAITSANVPAGTTITTIVGTTITMSGNATGTASGTAATFAPFVSANAPAASGGSMTHVQSAAELASHLHTGTTNGESATHIHNFNEISETIAVGGTGETSFKAGGTRSPVPTGANTTDHTHTFTSASTGSSAAASIIQPTLTVNYIIKVAPNTSGAGGVVSLGGMAGDIVCDSSFVCAPVGSVNTIGCAIATTSQIGCVKPDGVTTFVSADGTITTASASSQIIVGTTAVTGSATNGYILYNNAGVLGNLASTGTGNVVRANSPTIATPTLTGSNFITNTNLVQAAAATLKGNPTSGTANVQDFTIQGLATASLNATNDYIPVYNAATGTIRKTTPGSIASTGTLPTISNNQILANTSGGSGVPIGTNATTWFDSAYCNTAGFLIARFVGVWTCSQNLPINVTWFGVDNTGVTDGSAIIQAIITNNTDGNCLFFPAGSYKFTGITSANPVCILGVGGGIGPGVVSSTYLTRFLNSSNTGNLFHITSYYASIFRDFQVTAFSGTPTAGISIYLDSSGVTNQTRSQITGVTFYNIWTGIQILRPFFPLISGNNFQIWGNYGIIMTTSAGIEGGGGMITNNLFFGDQPTTSSTAAIYSEVGYIDINNNAILGGPYGIFFNINNNPAGFIKVHDNTIENFGTHGILLQSLDGSTASMVMIQNNEFSVFTKTPSSCMFIVDSTITPAWITGVQIQGNVCQNTTTAGGRAGVWLGAGKNVNISNNVFNELGGNSPYGITVGGVSTNAGLLQPIQILDNSFTGTYTAKYLVSVTGIPVIRDLSSGLTVAQAIAAGAAAGSQFYATDATVPSSGPCTGGGGGSLLLIESGTSRCP